MFILGLCVDLGFLSQSYLKSIFVVVIKLSNAVQFLFIDKTIQAFFKVSTLNIDFIN